jgi:hypothetical protein
MQLLLVISDISVNFQTGDSRLIASAQDKGKDCRLRAGKASGFGKEIKAECQEKRRDCLRSFFFLMPET